MRGDRTDMPLIFPLEHEMTLQDQLHRHGIPTPAVHGWIDDPMAYVMDRVGGQQDFQGTSDADRVAAVDDYLQILARMHALDVEPFAEAGIMRAASPQESGWFGMSRYEQRLPLDQDRPGPVHGVLPRLAAPEPAAVQGPGVGHRVGLGPVPQRATGRIVAVLDVEIGHIGDPMMDLAAWRMRDTIVGYGDFHHLYARYEELSGTPVDVDALMRHHFAFTLSNQLAVGEALRAPNADTDLMTNMQWCYETNLFATEALAEIIDVELPTVDEPVAARTRATTPVEHLADVLRTLSVGPDAVDDEFLRYRLRALFREARHAGRALAVGASSSEADLDDLHVVLGHRPDDWFTGEEELERFVLADAESGSRDEDLPVAVPPPQPAGPRPARPARLGHGHPPADPDLPLTT